MHYGAGCPLAPYLLAPAQERSLDAARPAVINGDLAFANNFSTSTSRHDGAPAAASGESDSTFTVAHSECDVVAPPAVEIGLSVVDQAGNQLTEVRVGESFTLSVHVEDLRTIPKGVFAA